MHCPEAGAHDLQVGIFLHRLLDHLPVALQRQHLPVLLLPLDPKSQAICKVMLISQNHIHILHNFPVHLLRPGIAAVGRPEGGPVVQIIGHQRAVLLRGFDGRQHGL